MMTTPKRLSGESVQSSNSFLVVVRTSGGVAASGGVAVLAHPIQLRTENDAQFERVVKDLVDLGLVGIEVIHSDHDESWVQKCAALANRFGLIKTGGSDFHGSNKKDIALGSARGRRIPREMFDALVKKLKPQTNANERR